MVEKAFRSARPGLPTQLADAEPRHREKKTAATPKERVRPNTDESARKAIVALEREQRRREGQRRKEEAARQKQRMLAYNNTKWRQIEFEHPASEKRLFDSFVTRTS